MNIESYSICRPVKGICKQWAIWGNSGSKTYPLVYLQRPKWIDSDEGWETLMRSIRLDITETTLLRAIGAESDND